MHAANSLLSSVRESPAIEKKLVIGGDDRFFELRRGCNNPVENKPQDAGDQADRLTPLKKG